MKAHFNIVCVVMVVLCLVAESESWWPKRSRSSRGSSSSSTSSSSTSSSSRRSSSSSSSSSSSRYRSSSSSSSSSRRRWGLRWKRTTRKPAARIRLWPFSSKIEPSKYIPPPCSLRFGTGCNWNKVKQKSQSDQTKSSNIKPKPATASSKAKPDEESSKYIPPPCSLRFGTGCTWDKVKQKSQSYQPKSSRASTSCSLITGLCTGENPSKTETSDPRHDTKQASTTSSKTKSSESTPVQTVPSSLQTSSCNIEKSRTSVTITKWMLAAIIPPTELGLLFAAYGDRLFNLRCTGIITLLRDIFNCSEMWRISFDKPENLSQVFTKKVVEMQIVERPMGHCKYTTPPPTKALTLPQFKNYNKKTIKCLNCNGVRTSMSGKTDRVMHSGVIFTTEDGSKYLIHKGKKFGTIGKRTEIVKPNDPMYDKVYRNVGGPIKPKNHKIIEEYFKASGNGYDFMKDNCHDGTERMIKLANKP